MPAAAAVNVVEQEDANRIYEAVPSMVVGQSHAIPFALLFEAKYKSMESARDMHYIE